MHKMCYGIGRLVAGKVEPGRTVLVGNDILGQHPFSAAWVLMHVLNFLPGKMSPETFFPAKTFFPYFVVFTTLFIARVYRHFQFY